MKVTQPHEFWSFFNISLCFFIKVTPGNFIKHVSMKYADYFMRFFNVSLWRLWHMQLFSIYLYESGSFFSVSLWKLQPFSIYLFERCICLSMYLNESGNLFQYISMKFQSFLKDNRGATPVQKSIRHHRSASLSRKTRNAIPENSNEDLSNLDEDPIPVR